MVGSMITNMISNYVFYDTTNKLMAEVVFNPEYQKKSLVGKFTSNITSVFKNSRNLNDDIEITIYSYTLNENKIVKKDKIVKAQGNWLGYIKWENE
jgi:hypothetical protein